MNVTMRLAAVAILAASLGACGKSDTATKQGAKAGGQILERSVTDEMEPYDTLRSQAPLARPSDGEEGGNESDPAADSGARPDAE